jgi:hypothetical protein
LFPFQTEKKINSVMSEPLERALSKSLQRGEDPQFDQLLSSFGSVAEHCLPSVRKNIFVVVLKMTSKNVFLKLINPPRSYIMPLGLIS